MKLRFCCIFLFLAMFATTGIHAQTATGEWRAYPAYHNAVKSVRAFSRIYVLSDGSLYSYDPDDSSVRTYDKVNTLSDSKIADIGYSSREKAVIICYRNGNIDFLYENDDVYNITDFLNSKVADKGVNELTLNGDKAYISTNSGILVCDIHRKEISGLYDFCGTVFSTIVIGNNIVCTSQKGMFKGNIGDNLLDPGKWQIVRSELGFRKMEQSSTCIFVMDNSNNLFVVDTDKKSVKVIDSKVNAICSDKNNIYSFKDKSIRIYESPDEYNDINTEFSVSHILTDGNSLWACCGENGLQKCILKNNVLTVSVSNIIPDSPVHNYFDYMSMSGDGKLLVAGGSHNYTGVNYEGTVMSFKDGKWYNFPNAGIEEKTGLKYINITSVVEDPEIAGHYYASSFGHGIYEFKDGEFINRLSYDNSPLSTILPYGFYPQEYVRINGLQYDRNGNLWMLNNEVDTIIRVKKSDGKWKGLYYKPISGLSFFKQFTFDSRGLVWTASKWLQIGIFCLDYGGTIDDESDDRYVFTGSVFTNQDGIADNILDINFIEEDLDGVMWIGTDKGIFIIEEPESFLSEKTHIFKRIKVPRNDGTNQADYLLSSVNTTAICIDDGNRKWIGTSNNGIYLIDKSGINTIEHFTTENSPLISNHILSIKINRDSGEVYIGTDEGLIVFGGDAFKSKEKLEKSSVSVYPNPVLPEYEDKITVRGLKSNSIVKILDSEGHVIHEGNSNGGGFSWNCRIGNRRVPSGVYFVMAIDENGNSSVVSRFTILR